MVKRQAYTDVDRYMTEYRMRTSYATPTATNRSSSGQHSGRSTHKHAAHERSHAKHNPTEAFYHSQGRIDKSQRKKKAHPEQISISTNQSHHDPVPMPPKKSSCCTIL